MKNKILGNSREIRLGIDFDNTIVSYDRLMHKIAVDLGFVDTLCPISKTQVRDRMRGDGRENDWIKLQGLVYGKQMIEAVAFPGVIGFFRFCTKNEIPVCIISHKTKYSKKGPRYDLHESAMQWIRNQGLLDNKDITLTEKDIFFCETRSEKISKIIDQGCTHFIDDLPEFLLEPDFPEKVTRILFDPNGDNRHNVSFFAVDSWDSLLESLLLSGLDNFKNNCG